jgi:hypothetical protein
MPEVITAPPARPPVYGFLALIQDSTSLDPQFRMALIDEFAWLPEACGIGGVFAVGCSPGNTALSIPASPSVVNGHGFVVWAGDKCSTFGTRNRDWQGLARRRLAATESALIAGEVWSGAIATAQGYANRPLASVLSDTVTNGPAAVVPALAAVEQAVATLGHGAPGLIHCTVQTLTHLSAAFAIYKTGNVWVTASGNVVIADAGYNGSGPDGTPAGSSQWMYGTSLMSVRLGPPDIGEPFVVWDTNDEFVIAQRPVAVQWDHCVHVAAQVDIPVGLIGGVS